MSPTLRRTSRRVTAVAGFVAIILAGLFVPTRAEAAPITVSPGQPGSAYSAAATGDIADVTAVPLTCGTDPLGAALCQIVSALGLPATSVANLHLVHSAAVANSTGIGGGADRTAARAANLDPLTALSVDLSSLLSEVSQTAPPDNATPNTAQLLGITPAQSGNLLDVGVAEASALAHWKGDNQCVAATEPLADATNDVAHAGVLPNPTGGVAFAGPGNGAVSVHSTVSLPTTTAFTGVDPRAVQADATTQVAQVNLFNNALQIQVVTPPTVTANATGIPGTATASFTQPVLTINGNPVINGMDLSNLLGPVFTNLNTLLQPLSQAITLTVSIADGTTNVSADGTSASASASLLTLHLGLIGTPILDLQVLPLTANATAPAGGLDCGQQNPITIGKTASRAEITPGQSFNYTITFTNTSATCTLTNTSLTDVITFDGPDGSVITGTDPTATSVDGLTVTWGPDKVGDLAPGQSKSFTVTIQSPATAQAGQSYNDTATGTGDCNGKTYTAPFTLNHIPTIVAALLARTGGDSTFGLLGLAALGFALLGYRRLRRV